jgi:hypothetical protein
MLHLEENDCIKKINKISEIYNTSVARIKHKFSVLKTQIESKESSLLALAERAYKDQIAKLEKLNTQIL